MTRSFHAAILGIAIVFALLVAAFTIRDIARHGVTPVSAAAIVVAFIFLTGLVGALRHPPEQ